MIINAPTTKKLRLGRAANERITYCRDSSNVRDSHDTDLDRKQGRSRFSLSFVRGASHGGQRRNHGGHYIPILSGQLTGTDGFRLMLAYCENARASPPLLRTISIGIQERAVWTFSFLYVITTYSVLSPYPFFQSRAIFQHILFNHKIKSD